MKRIISLISISFLICFYSNVEAQVSLQLKVDVFQGSTKGAKIHVVSSVYKEYTQNVRSSGKNIIKLKFNDLCSIYVIKKGYVSKLIEVNSDIAQSAIDEGTRYNKKKISITLFPVKDNIDVSLFQQPVIKYAYDRDMDDFMRDREYELAIADKSKEIEDKLRIADVQTPDLAVNTPETVAPKVALPSTVESKKAIAVENNNQETNIPIKKVTPVPVETAEPIAEPKPVRIVKPKAQPKAQGKQKVEPKPVLVADSKPLKKSAPRASIVDNSSTLIYPLPYIKTQIPFIDQVHNLSSVQLEDLKSRFNSLINKANDAFSGTKYLLSKMYFSRAAALMHLDVYSKEKYNSIDKIIINVREQKISSKHEKLIAKADSYYQRKSFIYSRYYYNLAQQLKPNDKRVTSRLSDIKERLAK